MDFKPLSPRGDIYSPNCQSVIVSQEAIRVRLCRLGLLSKQKAALLKARSTPRERTTNSPIAQALDKIQGMNKPTLELCSRSLPPQSSSNSII